MAIGSCLSKETKYPNKPLYKDTNTPQETQQEKIKRRMMEQMRLLNQRFEKEG